MQAITLDVLVTEVSFGVHTAMFTLDLTVLCALEFHQPKSGFVYASLCVWLLACNPTAAETKISPHPGPHWQHRTTTGITRRSQTKLNPSVLQTSEPEWAVLMWCASFLLAYHTDSLTQKIPKTLEWNCPDTNATSTSSKLKLGFWMHWRCNVGVYPYHVAILGSSHLCL